MMNQEWQDHTNMARIHTTGVANVITYMSLGRRKNSPAPLVQLGVSGPISPDLLQANLAREFWGSYGRQKSGSILVHSGPFWSILAHPGVL